MKLSELMSGITVQADFEGFVTNDDMVLAIDLNSNATTATAVADYAVLQMGVAGLDAQRNPISQDKIYVRAGQSTTKTGDQRTFAVSGDRYIGDDAQDFIFSNKIAAGTGNAVIVNYVYFNILNGKGEKGRASVIVNSDGGGNAGENASISVDLKKSGSSAVEFDWGAESVSNGGGEPVAPIDEMGEETL